MDRADPCAGQHRHSGFRHHRQIDRHPVAAFDPQGLHRIGQAADLVMQFAIGHMAADVGVVAFPDDRRGVGAFRQMPVETGHRGVQYPIFEPLDRTSPVKLVFLILVGNVIQARRLASFDQ